VRGTEGNHEGKIAKCDLKLAAVIAAIRELTMPAGPRHRRKIKAKVVAKCDPLRNLRFAKSLPYAFTEHGPIQAANILNSDAAADLPGPGAGKMAPLRDDPTCRLVIFCLKRAAQTTDLTCGRNNTTLCHSHELQ
jgi:hypothetical protein